MVVVFADRAICCLGDDLVADRDHHRARVRRLEVGHHGYHALVVVLAVVVAADRDLLVLGRRLRYRLHRRRDDVYDVHFRHLDFGLGANHRDETVEPHRRFAVGLGLVAVLEVHLIANEIP